jgi:hypothetical protein
LLEEATLLRRVVFFVDKNRFIHMIAVDNVENIVETVDMTHAIP